jgi:hypothetical protein
VKRREFLTQACMITAGQLMAGARPAHTTLKRAANRPSSSGVETKCRSLEIRLMGAKNPVLDRAVEILGARIYERCGVKPEFGGTAECNVELSVEPGIGKEGFLIEDAARRSVRIIGNDSRGLLYGVGKFLRSNNYHDGFFTLGNWTGTSLPDKPLRGVCTVPHFFNFYHVAPIEQMQHYMEDLALWGFNLIVFGFDIHKFESIQDPAAQAMLRRMNAIGRIAKSLGLDIGMGIAVNDGYANSPEAMRADWTAGHDGYIHELAAHYHLELCPNKPGAKELLLQWRRETLQAFKEVGLDYVILWPYDNGGCTNSQCKPWGANGFLTLSQPIGEMAQSMIPGCRVILSTWLFDYFTSGEYVGLEERFGKERPEWIDYILVDEFTGVKRYSGQSPLRPTPGEFPLVGFPEVSMWGAYPWGGFGANPAPAHHQKLWNAEKDILAGGFLYSEGIFEDLNKVLYAQFYWRKDRTVDSIIDEYIAYEFSPAVVDPVRRAIEILETNLARRAENLEKGVPRFVLEHTNAAGEALSLIRKAEKQLSSRARASWRWRILYLRALVDNELVKNDFRVSPRCERALQELTKIYYAQQAILPVSPVTKQAVERHRGVVGRDL